MNEVRQYGVRWLSTSATEAAHAHWGNTNSEAEADLLRFQTQCQVSPVSQKQEKTKQPSTDV